MSDLDRKASVSVSINGEQAKKELEELKKIGKGLQTQLAKAHEKGNQAAIERVNKEIQKNKSEMNKMKRLAYDVQFAMQAMDSASPRELRRTLRAINEQMQSGKVARGSAEWDEYAKAASRVKAELAQINQETKAAEPLVTRLGSSLKSAFTGWIGGAALIGGATFSAAQAIEAYTSIEESLADVKKYTGLAGVELDELQDKFKQMDTRRAREELNRFAGEAGRLGLKTVDAVYDFVEVADILNNALGADLGEDGIRQIGKIADYFGEKDRIGLRASMLATGSAINELGQDSSANEAFIAQFLERISQVGKVAKISQTDIMGFASVLDQSMGSVERSSTALQNVIIKMTTDPTEYAKVAGISLKEFSSILEQDANTALLKFFEGLNRLGGLTEISPVLDKMQLSGQGVSSTITAMASNLDKVRDAQALANKAYAEGNSVIEEASIVNNTAAAQIEKKKNQLRELSAELGEKLLPVQLSAMDGLKQIMKVLAATAQFIYDNKRAITTLVVAYTTYNAVVKLTTFWNKHLAASKYLAASASELLSGNIKRATVAVRAFTRAIKANPLALFLSIVVAAVGALWTYISRVEKATSVTSQFAKMNKEATKSVAEEKSKVESLYNIAKDENIAKEKRIAAIEKLNEISPEYLGFLDLETIKTEKASKAISQYVNMLKNQELAKRAVSKLADAEGEYQDWLDNMPSWTKAVYEMTEEEAKQAKWGKEKQRLLKKELAYKEAIAQWTQKVSEYTEKTLEPSTDKKVDPTDPKPVVPIVPITPTLDPEQLYKDRLAKLDTYHAIEKAKIAAYYANGLIDKAQYDSQVEQLDIEVMQQRIELYEEGTKERAELEEKLLLKQKEIGDRSIVQSREALKAEADAQRNAYGQAYIDGEMSHESYLQNMFNTELQYQQNLAKTYAEGSNERADIEKRIQDMLIRDKTEKERAFQQARQQLIKQYSDVGAEEMYNLEMEALNSLHAEKLISEENFQKAKKDIEERYQGDLSENFLESEAGQNMINKTQFALSQMQTIMGGFNNFMMAEADAQIASIDRKYDAEIKAAGGNQARVKEIEERKQKEIAKVKAKYADRALAIQMAIAVAQAVQGAINAYSSTAAIPIIGPAMAPVAAGIALAAGMLNVAAIKKQHAVAKQGFYKGGFTGNGRWDEEKGVVHAKEFVANRHAVDNPAVRPVLDFIDTAQRNNTIGSITEEDISRQLYPNIMGRATAPAQPDTPVVDNSALIDTLAFTASTVKELKERLAEPFVTINTVDGDYGMKRAFDDYNAQEKNKSR